MPNDQGCDTMIGHLPLQVLLTGFLVAMPASLLLYTKELMHHHAAPFDESRTDSAPIFKPTEHSPPSDPAVAPRSPICKARLLNLA